MSKKRKICVITGSRAEYGILKSLIQSIKNSKNLRLMILATGTHLSKSHGYTIREIKTDGFKIDKKTNINIDGDSPEAIASSISVSIKKFTEDLSKLRPDIVCLCGDRFEILSAAIACTLLQIPIAHLHGGELTYGSFDESFRHSITKMSHLHFSSTNEYRKRIIQMGENPKNVFYTGSILLDSLSSMSFTSKKELEKI